MVYCNAMPLNAEMAVTVNPAGRDKYILSTAD